MKKLYILLIFNLLAGASSSIFAQETAPLELSLNRACTLAIDSNIQVVNARIEIEKSHFHEMESKSKLYPTLDGYSNFNYYYAIPKMMMPGEMFGESGEIAMEIGTKFDWSSGFKASLSLFNLSNYTAIQLAKSLKNMNGLSLEQKKEEILYQVHQVYYLCQSTDAQIVFLNKNMENTDKLLYILDNQMKQGAIRKIDYSKLTVTKNNLQTQIDNLAKLKLQQTNLLKFIVGLDKNAQVELTDSLSEQNIMIYASPDLTRRNDIKLLENQIEVAQLNKKSISQSYLPTLSATGELYYQGQQNKFNFFDSKDKFFKVGFIGLSLNIPIFDGFEKRYKIKQYKSEIAQLQNTKEYTFNSLQKDFSNAVAEYNNSLKTIKRQVGNIKVAEENYTVCFQQYKQQTLLLSELILAENSLTDARLTYVDALLQLKNAELELKKLNGDLTK
ncbi:TolC family protein [Bacteroidaceae bacterium HV4-6-C5C]|jgi:outer membrane protein TolC|nr:TolC family protein [Bacteroidaceae bacterium HV4-6-C5C]